MKSGLRVKVKNAPAHYQKLLAPLPGDVAISARFRNEVDLWHFFTKSKTELARQLPLCMREIRQDGMIWISWPKKSSGIASTVTEDTIRAVALSLGLVDVKVCAVDDVWSGLKLVIRKENRRKSK
ncbi:MAG: DUF3052 family protein [Gemmatimonadetes bacterium]|nr:DUF3052 family protein [Gemmatimonadota bacterium]